MSAKSTDFYHRATLTPAERAEMENLRAQAVRQEQSIAPTESGSTASRPYKSGDYFFLDGIFCRAKAAIAQGSRFTKDTNYEEKILAVELAALNQ